MRHFRDRPWYRPLGSEEAGFREGGTFSRDRSSDPRPRWAGPRGGNWHGRGCRVPGPGGSAEDEVRFTYAIKFGSLLSLAKKYLKTNDISFLSKLFKDAPKSTG